VADGAFLIYLLFTIVRALAGILTDSSYRQPPLPLPIDGVDRIKLFSSSCRWTPALPKPEWLLCEGEGWKRFRHELSDT